MDKRKFASYSCFVIFSLIDMIITMLMPSREYPKVCVNLQTDVR